MASETKPKLKLRSSEQRVLLMVGDFLVGALALVAALYFWLLGEPLDWWKGIPWNNLFTNFLKIRVDVWYYLLPLVWLLLLIDLYDLHRAASWKRTVRSIILAASVAAIVYLLVYFTSAPGSVNRRALGLFIILAPLLTLTWRRLYIRLYSAQGAQRRILALGAGDNGRTLAQMYKNIPHPPFNLLGFLDDDPAKIGTSIEGFRIYAGSDRLLDLSSQLAVSEVIVSITGEMRGETFQTLLDAQENGIDIVRMPTIYEELLGRVPIHHLESDWVLRSFLDEARSGGFYELGKRLLDILGGLVGMLMLLMMLPFIGLATVIDSGFPVFYWQERLGRGGREFKIVKFRTMRQDAEKEGKAQMAGEHDPRITRVGNFLRVSRLDEFPQFWNVLRGEMSLVGPRAERAQWVETFQKEIPFYRARLLVKPGITGWAQINYGYAATVEDTSVKLEYDLYYIKHRSIIMDIVIMLRTVGTVLGGKGR
jgi:exopolysaccharide biosynthesis polyprenyl glycosylphosphotransferase